MSRGLNKVQIIGRLGRDPEPRYTSEGKLVVNFSVATGGKWTDRDGQERDDTEWFRVDAWDRLAETCNQYLHKGDQVYIEGRLKTRKWQDKETGQDRYSTDVVASNMLILSPRGGSNTNAYEGDGDDEAPAPQSRPVSRAVAEPRNAAPAPQSRPAAPARQAPAARPAGRNQPQPLAESEDDIPF